MAVGVVFLVAVGGFFGFIYGAEHEKRYHLRCEAERKRKSRAKLKARKLIDDAFVPCGGRELFTK